MADWGQQGGGYWNFCYQLYCQTYKLMTKILQISLGSSEEFDYYG